jgi:hypothetical protein
MNKQQIAEQRRIHDATCTRTRHDSCIKDEPGWPLYIVVAFCVVVFGGSVIGFLVWVINGQKPF